MPRNCSCSRCVRKYLYYDNSYSKNCCYNTNSYYDSCDYRFNGYNRCGYDRCSSRCGYRYGRSYC